MLHPVGQERSGIYWRRRLIPLVLVVVVSVIAAVLLGGRSHRPGAVTAPGSASSSAPAPVGSTPSPTPTPTSPTPSAPTPSAGRSTPPRGNAPPATPTQVGRHTPLAPAQALVPIPAETCVPPDLRVRAEAGAASYSVRQLPVIRLTVSNISAVSCTGDFGPRNQEVVAFDGSKRIWGSNDCFPSDRSDLQKLRPGASGSYSMTWSGKTSRPRCAGKRTPVGKGSYRLIASIDGAESRAFTVRVR